MSDTLTTECALPTDGAVPAEGAEATEPTRVPATLAAAAVAGGALFIDVRSQPTRERLGGLPQAILADRTRLDEQFAIGGDDALPGVHDLEQPVVVICASENGSRPVAEALTLAGFTNVVHVQGGFPAWKAAGLEVTPGTETA